MIQFTYYGMREPLTFADGAEYLVIENPHEFYKTVNGITQAVNGEITEYMLADENGNEYSFSKYADIITDYVTFSVNDKKIISALYKKLNSEIDEDIRAVKFTSAGCNIVDLLDAIILDSEFDLIYDEDIELSDVFKICNLRVNQENTSLLEKTISYIDVKAALQRLKMIVFVNASGYYTGSDLENMLKHCRYKKINVLFIESTISNNIPLKTARIIDNDLCEFTIAVE